MDGTRSERVAASGRAGIDAEVPPDIRVGLWWKLASTCALLAGMPAAGSPPVGEMRDCPESWAMFRRLLEEVAAVAARKEFRHPTARSMTTSVSPPTSSAAGCRRTTTTS